MTEQQLVLVEFFSLDHHILILTSDLGTIFDSSPSCSFLNQWVLWFTASRIPHMLPLSNYMLKGPKILGRIYSSGCSVLTNLASSIWIIMLAIFNWLHNFSISAMNCISFVNIGLCWSDDVEFGCTKNLTNKCNVCRNSMYWKSLEAYTFGCPLITHGETLGSIRPL